MTLRNPPSGPEPRVTALGWSLVLVFALLLQGCGSIPEREPVPEELVEVAQIPGLPDARLWGDDPDPVSITRIDEFRAQVEAHPQQDPELFFLAISGGGQNGAFGAGLLKGWTESGTRPQFRLVTGVSTGALIAPFAFLGPEYDPVIEEIYKSYSTEDLLVKRGTLKGLKSDAFFDTEPMKELVARYFDQELLDAIGAEWKKGRRLIIGTTNLDADRPVEWDIGRIAASVDPNALELFHEIILASAAIPGAFPPVLIEVEADGRRYDEIHVDGGVTSQVIVVPPKMELDQVVAMIGLEGRPHLYVIRNSRLESLWTSTEPKSLELVSRSISAMIRTQGIGDLYRIYLAAQRDGMDFNLAYVPSTFDAEPEEQFDQAYMNQLFEFGYEAAKDGFVWQKAPPGFE